MLIWFRGKKIPLTTVDTVICDIVLSLYQPAPLRNYIVLNYYFKPDYVVLSFKPLRQCVRRTTVWRTIRITKCILIPKYTKSEISKTFQLIRLCLCYNRFRKTLLFRKHWSLMDGQNQELVLNAMYFLAEIHTELFRWHSDIPYHKR